VGRGRGRGGGGGGAGPYRDLEGAFAASFVTRAAEGGLLVAAAQARKIGRVRRRDAHGRAGRSERRERHQGADEHSHLC